LAPGTVQRTSMLGVKIRGLAASRAKNHVVVACPAVDGEPVPVLAGVMGGLEVDRRPGWQRLVVSTEVGTGAAVEPSAAVAVVDEPFGVASLVLDDGEAGCVQKRSCDAISSCVGDDEQ